MPTALASSSLGDWLVGPFGKGRSGPGGRWIVEKPELHPGEEILVPDPAGWRRERMPEYPHTADVPLAPDCVCAVLPASTRRFDLYENRPAFVLEGAKCLCLVDSVDRTLEAFELQAGRSLLVASAKGDGPERIRPFQAITFCL